MNENIGLNFSATLTFKHTYVESFRNDDIINLR